MKKDTISKEPVLRKIVRSKRKLLTPRAGVSLEKAMANIKQIFKKKSAEIKAKKKLSLIGLKSKSDLTSKLTSKHTSKSRSKPISKFISESTSEPISKVSPKPILLKEKIPKERGIVYVGHIPHGFYEQQIQDYFKQFGKITRVRVARSKKTGKSRGYGYVEFVHKNVAKIAAETMNNYLMCGRLLKATYIPPEKQHSGFFLGANWSEKRYPKLKNRQKETSQRNNNQSAADHKDYIKSSLNKLSTLESKLQMKGISIKFQPVDVP